MPIHLHSVQKVTFPEVGQSVNIYILVCERMLVCDIPQFEGYTATTKKGCLEMV